jgi:hypothetical protein
MYSYPYDPTGKAATNKFSEEHIVSSDNRNERVVRVRHAPFFKPLTITYGNSDTPLTEGVDFEYAYELPELDDSVVGPVYMGVNLINPQVAGSVRIAGQLLGGTFYQPYYEMLDDLIKHLNNPISASWLSTLNRPALMPPTPSATSWDDLLNKKYLASAIRDLKVGSEVAHAAIKAKLDALKAEVEGIYRDIVAFDYPGHAATWNPHDTDVAQIGAHPESAKVPDAMMAYGKTLRTLTAEVRALGLSQTEVDKYLAYNCFKDVSGVFVQMIAPNRPLFRSAAGETELLFTDTTYEIRSNGAVVLAVGVDLTDTAESYIEWVVGPNKLRVTSSANQLGMASLTLNGAALLNGVTIQDYQAQSGGGTDPDDNELKISGVGIRFEGKGSLTNQVKGHLIIPQGTTAAAGAVKLKSTPGTESAGYAAATDAVAAYQQQQSNFVLKDTRINDQKMDKGSLIIDKTSLRMGNVDNTADMAKPLSKDLRDALMRFAEKNHKHDWNGFGILPATTESHGVTKYASTIGGLAQLKAVAPAVLVELATRAESLRVALQNTNPSAVVDFAAVDKSVWQVNSGRNGLSVQDLRYFFVLSGERKEGRTSGTVNLDTTPMFNWMLATNTDETRWAPSVLHDKQLTTDLGDLPTCAVTVGRKASEMGALAYSSMLFKERVMIPRGQLRVRCQAEGKITVYVNGVSQGSGNDFVAIAVNVKPDLEHTVAIRVDADAPTKIAGAWYDILDRDFPMAYSQPGSRVGTLEEFYNPNGMRHYLYMNMRSGSLFSRAEIAPTLGIDLTMVLIGHIDVPISGLVAGASTALGGMVDYGEFKELTAHADLINVHKPTLADFAISDAPAMQLGAIVETDPMWYGARKTGIAGGFTKKFGRIDASFSTPVGQLMLGFSTRTNHPGHWTTPNNPQELGHDTIDGVMVINSQTVTGIEAEYDRDLWFFVGHHGQNPSAPAIHINLYDNVMEHGLSPMAPGLGDSLLPATPRGTIGAVLSYVAGGDEDIDYAQFGYENGEVHGADWQLARRIIVRYRYVPATRTLRLCYDIYRNGIAKRWWREYVLSIDIAHLFKSGVVGVERRAVAGFIKWQMFASWLPMMGGSFATLRDKFEYTPSLLDGYSEYDSAVESTAVTTVAGKPSPQQFLGTPFWGGEITEFVAVPKSGGMVAHNHGMLWPAFCYSRVPGIFAVKKLHGQLWDYAPTDYKGIVPKEGFYIITDVPSISGTTLVSCELNINCQAEVMLGGVSLLTAAHPTNTPAPALYTSQPAVVPIRDSVKLNRLQLEVKVPAGYIASNLSLTFKLKFDNGGTQTEWVMTGDQDIYYSEYGFNIAKKNPWSMTQRTLELLRARAKAQKAG